MLMSFSHLLSVRWRQWGIALAVALGSFAAVPAMAQVTDLINVVPTLNLTNLTFDRTTCLNICEESGRTCPREDRTCGDGYITCRTQCFKGVSATPRPVSTNQTPLTQPGSPQPIMVAPSAPSTSVNTGSSDLNDRIAALEALIIKYISLCQAGSCCAIGQQVQQPIVVGTNPNPAPGVQPTFDLTPIGTVQQPGAVTTAPASCADCAKLPAGTTKLQCEAAFKCTATSPTIVLTPPKPTLPTPAPTAPTAPPTIPPISNPTPSVPGVGTAPGGITLTPQPNYYTPYQSWSDSCKAACQNNSLIKSQALKDQCKVDNCSVNQYKGECSAYCKANNTASGLASQCVAKC
jgi:hypothetical protein